MKELIEKIEEQAKTIALLTHERDGLLYRMVACDKALEEAVRAPGIPENGPLEHSAFAVYEVTIPASTMREPDFGRGVGDAIEDLFRQARRGLMVLSRHHDAVLRLVVVRPEAMGQPPLHSPFPGHVLETLRRSR